MDSTAPERTLPHLMIGCNAVDHLALDSTARKIVTFKVIARIKMVLFFLLLFRYPDWPLSEGALVAPSMSRIDESNLKDFVLVVDFDELESER